MRGANLFSFYLPSGQGGKDEQGFFETGDLGRWDEEGQLHVLGRADDVIVTGGENVHPLQVEAALEEIPEIAAAAVFPLPDEEWGQIVAAALVPGRRPTAGSGRAARPARGAASRHSPCRGASSSSKHCRSTR